MTTYDASVVGAHRGLSFAPHTHLLERGEQTKMEVPG
jgi:hypothetical protein